MRVNRGVKQDDLTLDSNDHRLTVVTSTPRCPRCPWMEQVDTQLIVLRFTADDVVAMPADLGSTCGAVVNDVQV
jgi:hypothetical protein